MSRPWHRLRVAYLHALADMNVRRREVTSQTFWGDPMTVVLGEPVSEQILRHGYFEEGLSQTMIEWLRPGMTVFDVGAHFGYFSLLAARLVGPGGRVYAFEPMPRSFEILARNTRAHANITGIPSPVFSLSGTLAMTDYGVRSSAFSSFTQPRAEPSPNEPHSQKIEVQATTLDDFCDASKIVPHFVKIDVESAEAHVLQGMQRLIERNMPAISLEVGDVGIPGITPSRVLVDRFIGFGYRPFEYGSSEQPLRAHQPRETYGADNLFFAPVPIE
jgi:FkbM family methyltransferase